MRRRQKHGCFNEGIKEGSGGEGSETVGVSSRVLPRPRGTSLTCTVTSRLRRTSRGTQGEVNLVGVRARGKCQQIKGHIVGSPTSAHLLLEVEVVP